MIKPRLVRSGKAKQTGPNLNKQLKFVRDGVLATRKRATVALAHANDLTAQDVFERNYDKLELIRIIRGSR